MSVTLVDQINDYEILAKRAEQTMSGVNIDNKFGHIMDLQANQGTEVSEDDDLDTYVTPGTYFIPSASLMVTLSNTPYAQMQLSDAGKTGQSHLYVFRTKNDEWGRVTQLLITPYLLDPADDNAYGIWYRQSGDVRDDTWGLWHRVGEGGSGSGLVRYTGNSITQTWPNWDDMLTDLDAGKDVILVVLGGTGLVLDYYVTEWSSYGVPFIELVSNTNVMHVSKNTGTGVWTIAEHRQNADTVDWYHISVGNLGTDANTIYFV